MPSTALVAGGMSFADTRSDTWPCRATRRVARGCRYRGEIRNVRINGVDIAPLVEAEVNRRYPQRRNSTQPTRTASARRGRSSSGRGRPPPSAPSACRPICCTSGSMASTRSSRRCATSCSPPTHGCAARTSASRSLSAHSASRRRDGARPERAERCRRATIPGRSARTARRPHAHRSRHRDARRRRVAGETDPGPPPSYPPAGSYPVRRCLRAIVNEEWLHRLYAERDLAALEHRARLNPPRPAAAAGRPDGPGPSAVPGRADRR